MASKFKVGDRVAVYGVSLPYGYHPRLTGEVVDVFPYPPDGIVRVKVRFDDAEGQRSMVPVKQCRRLVKRERRQLWVRVKDWESCLKYVDAYKRCDNSDLIDEPLIQFIEVKPAVMRQGEGEK